MSVALTERAEAGRGARLFDPGGVRTLEDAVGAVSRSLTVRGSARCLVCGATLIRCPEDDPNAPAAECPSCASSLE
jgi:hypothetical protein